jgi:hypothetical protein
LLRLFLGLPLFFSCLFLLHSAGQTDERTATWVCYTHGTLRCCLVFTRVLPGGEKLVFVLFCFGLCRTRHEIHNSLSRVVFGCDVCWSGPVAVLCFLLMSVVISHPCWRRIRNLERTVSVEQPNSLTHTTHTPLVWMGWVGGGVGGVGSERL